MYEYILVESEYSDEEFRQYMSKVQALFREGMRKYGDCAAYLFYTSYIATSYFEYYMGLTEYDAEKMAYQALQREPENLLYQWFRYNFVSHNKGAACERKRILCAKKILQDENLVLELRNMLLVGDDLLNCLRIDVGEIETF